MPVLCPEHVAQSLKKDAADRLDALVRTAIAKEPIAKTGS
jgi:hypothetical protein